MNTRPHIDKYYLSNDNTVTKEESIKNKSNKKSDIENMNNEEII